MLKVKSLGKLTAALGMLFMVGGAVSAADIKANILMRGEMMRAVKEKDSGDMEYSYLLNNPVVQKDNPGDGILIDYDGGIAGAHLALWYKTAADNGADANEQDDWTAHFRRTYVWFKPIDMLKLRFGYVGNDTFFKERIDEWKVGNPFAITERDWSAHPGYINCNDGEGWGMAFELRPIDQLIFNAGITPGKKGAVASDKASDTAGLYNKEGDSKTLIAPWGAGVKYYWNKFEFQASYRDGGMDADRNGTWSVARFGVGYSDERTYSFIQPVLGFDYNSADETWELNGMCLDLYSELFFDAWTFKAHVPVTLRWSGDKTDVNYLECNLMGQYNFGSYGNVDDLTPYLMIGSNSDDALYDVHKRAWILDNDYFSDSFNLTYQAGLMCKIAKVEVDVGVKFCQLSEYAKADGNEWTFSIPFCLKVRNF